MPLQCEIGATLWKHSNTSHRSTLKRPEGRAPACRHVRRRKTLGITLRRDYH
jgi:hypothetical protein